jgi:NAD(P)H dehydrogenase (quinone)
MKNIVIVYHSDKGHTQKIAEAIESGVRSTEYTEVLLIPVEQVDQHFDKLDNADAIVFGSPTYMGTISAPFKAFMDSTSGRWFGRTWVNKIAAGFTSSGSLSGDKLATLNALAIFAAQHGMIWLGPEQICETPTPDAATVNRLGSNLGVMCQAHPYEDAEKSVSIGDIETARLFGIRIAKITTAFEFTKSKKKEEVCQA